MIGSKLPGQLLCCRLIPNLSPSLAQALGLRDAYRAIGLVSADSDDLMYLALDEAAKSANVEVVYARSLYAGAANATTALAGEVIGVLAGPTPAEVASGLRRVEQFLAHGAAFESASRDDRVVYLAHCVAPPVEALVGLDAALKASDVELKQYFRPPTETNFSGGLLTGTQSACQAACDAFGEAIRAVASQPQELGGM